MDDGKRSRMVAEVERPSRTPFLSVPGLEISASPRASLMRQRWFDCTVEVASHPFAGRLETIFT